MKLHDGQYYWPNKVDNILQYPSISEDINCECLIIGGGIGGALCASLLARKGTHTVLADKRAVAHGSTMANTGLLQYTSDKTLQSFIATFGQETGVHFYNLSLKALQQLKAITANFPPEAKLIPRNSLYLASTEDDARMLRQEYNMLITHGFPAEWWDKNDISARFPFTRPAAIYTSGDAEVNPFACVQELIREAATTYGAHIYENSEIDTYQFHEDSVTCRCGSHAITAKHVIFATGYETQQFKKDKGAQLTSSYVTVTEPVAEFNDWYERCLIWETARPYSYMRTTLDNRIIAGGLDEELPGGQLVEGRYISQSNQLLKMIHTMFPSKSTVQSAYAWGAVFGGTHDGLPYIGSHPDYPHCYFLEGYGGNGTVCSMIAAEMITDVLTGKPRPDMNLFSLTRSNKPTPS
jgi:glycine/D-amino acid oxidase-like deaminating enzyme